MTTNNQNAADILSLPMQKNDAKAKTVGDYLCRLLSQVIEEEEGFNGKRPFGNSGWIGELETALVRGGVVKGKLDSDGYLDHVDSDQAKRVLFDAIAGAFGGGK